MFNAKLEAENVINYIRDYYAKNNLKGAVIGISGGKDSAVVAAIMVNAIGKENVLGVTMPCHSNSEDRADAELIANHYGFEMINYDLTDTYDAFKKQLSTNNISATEDEILNSDINIKPRLRMTTLYYLTALYSAKKHGTYIVAGTSNKSELYVGYFTKGGDSVHDIGVLNDFTVSEVIAIGEVLGVPQKVLYKAPSDGLSGKTDEDKLGVTYVDIEKYIYGESLDEETKAKIKRLHDRNKHKFIEPAYKREKIGVYVGTFDPVHKGHTHVIDYLLSNKIVDRIIVIPTINYWDKTPQSPLKDRINMFKFFENEKVEVSTTLNELTYTYLIFRELRKKYQNDKLYLIMGADNIISFDKWENVDELLECNVIVLNRDNIDIKKYVDRFNQKDNFIIIDNFDYVPISSSKIRQNYLDEDLKKSLDDRVLKYIENNLLNKKEE